MHLFAIVPRLDPRVQRISLHQALQKEIQLLFQQQATAFLRDTTLVPFQAGFNPESDELLFIEPFPDPFDLLVTAQDPLACPTLDVNDHSINEIAAIYTLVDIDGQHSACIQAFDRRNALTKGRFTMINLGEGFVRLAQTGITLSSGLVAILQADRLIFRSYHQAGRIYDLTHFFHEATAEEVAQFAAHAQILLPEGTDMVQLAGTPRIRKQIALVMESGILDAVKAVKIANKAKKFKLKIAIDKSGATPRIVLPDNRGELKDVLDWLLENYYEGQLTSTVFVSNSKRSPQ